MSLTLVIVVLVVAGGTVLGSMFRADGGYGRYVRDRGGSRRGPQLTDGFDLVHQGIELWLRVVQLDKFTEFLEVRASVRVPSGLRLLRRHDWVEDRLPRIALELSTSRPEIEPPGLDAAWSAVTSRINRAVLACDDRAVVCNATCTTTPELLDAILDAVALIARWDDGLTDRLLALPGATALTDHELEPGVTLDPDGIVLGVRDRAQMVAQLGFASSEPATASVAGTAITVDGTVPALALEHLSRAGDGELKLTARGARYTWAAIERDPARLRAGIAALRALSTGAAPYR